MVLGLKFDLRVMWLKLSQVCCTYFIFELSIRIPKRYPDVSIRIGRDNLGATQMNMGKIR